MTFAELQVGDFFLWPDDDLASRDAVNINVKIAWSEDGGGFAIDLATRADIVPPGSADGEPPFLIPGDAHVIKLNGIL